MLFLYTLGTLCLATLAWGQTADTTDGTFFAVTFPPQKADLTTGSCQIMINAKVAANVTIEHAGSVTSYKAFPNATLQVAASGSDRTTNGLENDKVFYVTSDSPISVIAYSIVQTDQMDAVLVQPVTATSLEYYAVAYVNPSGFNYDCGTSSNTATFIVISATEDGTTVDIYPPTGTTPDETVTLNRNIVYTRKATLANDLEDPSGRRIVSDKPIAVSSGSACTHYASSSGYDSGVTWSSLPSVSNLRSGLHLSYEPDWSTQTSTYRVMVVGTVDGTNVNIDGTTLVVNRGEKMEQEVIEDTAEIDCDQPCLVTQVHKNDGDRSGIWQTLVSPVSEYNTYSVVATPVTADANSIAYVRIVTVATREQADGITINGLVVQNWECYTGNLGSNICKSNTRISGSRPVRIEIFSANAGVVFGGMAYSQNTLAEGYGLNLGYNAVNLSAEVPDSSTRLGYRISHEMNFTSSDGSDFDVTCAQDYSDEFQRSSQAMVIQVNQRIGFIMCMGLPADDIYMLTVSSAMVFDKNLGTTVNGWRLDVKGSLLLSEIEACGNEVSGYLADTLNWLQPIVPDLPGCPGVRFNSDLFTDVGRAWICSSSSDAGGGETTQAKTPLLQYGISHDGFLNATNNQAISPQCILDYTNALETKTEEQIMAVNQLISVDQTLCVGPALTITTGSASMTALGSQAFSNQNYILDPPNTVRLDEVYACAADISLHLQNHDNWVSPILPQVPGCPVLEWTPPAFFENELRWICV